MSSDPFGMSFTIQVPASALKRSRGDLTELGPADAERIAIALSSVLREADLRAGRPARPNLMSDWVEITKEREAGTYTVTVVDRDVMARVIPYTEPTGPIGIRHPMFAGKRLTGQKQYLRLDQHGQYIGQSDSGKSSLLQCVIAYATLCAERNQDVVIWVAGEHKLFDLVAGWTEPLLGLNRRCPIDWIAKGHQDALDMIAAAMRVGSFRQSIRMSERGNWPAIILILDEASNLLENQSAKILYNGSWMFADTMLADVVRYATQGRVYVKIATQHDVHAVLGTKGNTLQAQLKYAAMFKIRDDSTHGRQLGDYHLTMPRCKGEYWLDDGESPMPFRVKAPYIQTIDPDKEVLHDGLTIGDLALARRVPDHHGLDHASAVAAGEKYQNRRRIVDDEYIAYLTGIPHRQLITVQGPLVNAPPPVMADDTATAVDPDDNQEASGNREVDAAEAELAAALCEIVNLGDELPEEMAVWFEGYQERHPGTGRSLAPTVASSVTVEQVGAVVTSMADRSATWGDRIMAAVAEYDAEGISPTRGQVIERLRQRGHRVANPTMVSNYLKTLVDRGQLARDGDGYRCAQQAL